MKILQVIYSLSSGGGERFVIDLSNELTKNNDVHLCTIREETEENNFYKGELSEKVSYHCLNVRNGIHLGDLIKAYKFIRSIDAKIVHFHLNNIAIYFVFGIFFFRKANYFQTVHSDIKNGNYDFKSKLFGKIIFRRRVKLITISDEIDKISKRVYAVNKTRLIYNGRSFPKLSSDNKTVLAEISSYKRRKDEIVFLHIGRFHEQKNQSLLIEAFSRLESEGFNVVLLIIGRGFQSKAAEELVSKAKGCNIYFLGERNNVGDYLKIADAFCLSSISEGMPISLIEAFACGCVPISTPVSGSIDVIQNGVNGFLAKDFTIEEYVKALKSFIVNKDSIPRENLMKLYQKKFTMEKCAQDYISYFTEECCSN